MRSSACRSLGSTLLALAVGSVLLAALLVSAGCQNRAEVRQIAEKARILWESGRYPDAARNFVTLSELYPNSSVAEEALFWAASLYHHYLRDYEQASQHYQHLLVTYPRGRFFLEAKQNLAQVYEQKPDTRHRALQIYQQLLLAEPMAAQRDQIRFDLARLNLEMGKLDQARLESRDLLVNHPQSQLRGHAYYLIGYSYYLEKRYDMALFVFRRTADDFPGSPIALRAQYFVADTLEEQGQMREALKAYTALRGKYPNPDVVETRIKTLQARIRRGVR